VDITHYLIEKSRTAIVRLGATQKGILRNHMVMRDGFVRDSVLFSITAGEWSAIKTTLATKIQSS
jgi:RimJ/RimL family protein N-acetyltransferase